MHRDVAGHPCYAVPCPTSCNGYYLQFFEDYEIEPASYIIHVALQSTDAITTAIGHWVDRTSQLPEFFPRVAGVAMAAGSDIDIEKVRANAALLQRDLTQTYQQLFVHFGGHLLQQGRILAIASVDGSAENQVHSVSMTEFLLGAGASRSREFPFVTEELVNAQMMEHSWSSHIVVPHRAIATISLPETPTPIDQVVVIQAIQVPATVPLVLGQLLLDGELHGSQTFRDFDWVIFFAQPVCNRRQMIDYLHMTIDCQGDACLLSLNDRIMTEMDEDHQVPDGSVLRLWHDEEPLSSHIGLSSDQGDSSESERHHCEPSQPSQSGGGLQYVPGTVLQSFVHALCLILYFGQGDAQGDERTKKPTGPSTSKHRVPCGFRHHFPVRRKAKKNHAPKLCSNFF